MEENSIVVFCGVLIIVVGVYHKSLSLTNLPVINEKNGTAGDSFVTKNVWDILTFSLDIDTFFVETLGML